MRRFALLGLILLLPGCQFAGNPLAGSLGFIGDTHTWHDDPTAPVAQSENERRVRGLDTTETPLLPEPGDVWPGAPAPIPTMQDLQNLNNNEVLPPPNIPSGPMPPVFPQNTFPQNKPAAPGTTKTP
jgi:hypothetical protein